MRFKCVLKYLAVLVLPIWLLDGCLNRDPLIYIDKKYRLIGAWPGDLNLQELPVGRLHIQDVQDFRMNGTVLTGKCSKGYFIVERATAEQSIYSRIDERDAVLRTKFSTSASDLNELPITAYLRGNFFFPYNLIYYVGATVCIAVYCRKRRGMNPTSPG